MIKEYPKFYEYLSYIFFFPAAISGKISFYELKISPQGPVYDYHDYKQFMEQTGRYKSIPNSFKPAMY